MLGAKLRAAAYRDSGGGAFHPSDLFGAGDYGTLVIAGQSALYQDDAATIPVTAQDDPVKYVEDLSGNGVPFKISSSSLAPAYDETKGYPNIYFDGGDVMLTDTLASNIMDGGEGFMLVFGYTETLSAISIGMVEEGILNFDSYRIYLAFDGRSTKKRLFAYSPDGANRYIDADTEIQSADSYILAANGDAGSWLAYQNGVEQSGGFTSSATISGSSRLSIGRQTRDNGGLYLTGGMVGVLAIDRHLTPTELSNTFNYFLGLV